MKLDASRVRHLLRAFDFKALFIEELGWNHYNGQIAVILDAFSFMLFGVAEKHGMLVFTCHPTHADLLGGNRIELS